MELKWNVFRHNITKDEIVIFNVFEHGGFNKDVQKHLEEIKNKDEFAEELRRSLSYYFRAKAEYEIAICSTVMTRRNDGLKVDIYTQIINNFEIFVDYCWNSKM